MHNFRLGQLVFVKAYSGALLPRRIAGFSEYGPTVCTEEEYQAAKQEGREPEAVGWPVQYIEAAQVVAGV